MRICFFSTDWTSEPVPDLEATKLTGKPQFIPGKQRLAFGGTFLTRGAMPGMELKKHGYDCFLSWRIESQPDGTIRAIDTNGEWSTPDAIWIQRQMQTGFDESIRKARANGQVLLNDLDDSFGNGVLPTTNLAHQTTDPDANPDFNRVHYYRNLAASSAVTVSTQALYREMQVLGVPVYLLRNQINLEQWPQLDPAAVDILGWIGGVQWRARDLQQFRPWLNEWLADTGWGFYHGGNSQVPDVPKAWDLAGIDTREVEVTTAPLCHIAEYPRLWRNLGVSLIPLEDCRFNHAKSSLKALESSACGLPFIASDLPEQRWFVEHGGAGRLVKRGNPRAWMRHLDELLDPEVRRAEGQKNREHAEQFDIAHTWRQWADVFDEVAA